MGQKNKHAKYTPCLKKVYHFYFYDTFGNSEPIFIIFSLLNSEWIVRMDLWRKMELKLPPLLKSVAALPREM